MDPLIILLVVTGLALAAFIVLYLNERAHRKELEGELKDINTYLLDGENIE